jgi:energy-coupling factor transporter ATP-binding protein EcfA2
MRLWASVYCTATLLSWALGVTVDEKASTEKCGCTTATLPHPRIVLVGSTGVGKSTFGNRLFGITEHNGKEALCSQFDGYHFNKTDGKKYRVGHKFGTGHSTESHTQTTDWMVGHYLGDPSNPCITIIDTPGVSDAQNKDCEHGIALAKGIKEIGSINAFMLLFKGVDARFDKDIQEQIDLYLGIFGTEMWHNTITEFTFWEHNLRSIRQRNQANKGLNMTVKHAGWNREYVKRFSPTTKIPSVFIDPVYKERKRTSENEKKINKNQTDLLWKLLNDPSRKEFKCDKRCKAPSGFFSGQPWLLEDGAQKKRPEDRASITWQIWFADCDGSGTKSYTIKHKVT